MLVSTTNLCAVGMFVCHMYNNNNNNTAMAMACCLVDAEPCDEVSERADQRRLRPDDSGADVVLLLVHPGMWKSQREIFLYL